ncbi:heparan-alpha-glucosaminide N-acetyltransferase-like [Mya arenaria]|uniref:heparan-alpha-glucosaminide N-acetyltransferase-like n=1 Tax=Mya arenaria TaxID=6604 RepID=UPI0022DFF7FD|nr:heparan-alpha-glucosaminide N-acetyltransferase-like [Mya arenaria]
MADEGGIRKTNIVLLIFGLTVLGCTGNHHKHPCYKNNTYPTKQIDTAWITFNLKGLLHQNESLKIYSVSGECYMCAMHEVCECREEDKTVSLLVDTRWRTRINITSSNADSTCSEAALSDHFKEGGRYLVMVSFDGSTSKVKCAKPMLLNSPRDCNIPIYVAMGVFVFLTIIWYLFKWMLRERIFQRIRLFCCPSTVTFDDHTGYSEQDLGIPTNAADVDNHRPVKERLKSLDTFRGISIVLMIFVNYRGGYYWFFKHSKWNGLTVADLVFPWFVWIMGTAMAFSFQAQLRRSTPKKKMFLKIFKRSVILFALGLLINSSDGLSPGKISTFRIPGVLQRFAGTYLIVATMHMFFAKPNDPHQFTWWSAIRDLTDFWPEWVFNSFLVMVWCILTFAIKVPGCPKGYLGPGGWANDAGGHNVSNCTGGAAMYIDHKVFGTAHIYQHPTCKEIYNTTVAHDPEGLLGTLTSCLMCFLGLQAGKILRMFPDWKSRVKRFLIWGFILGVIATILCKGEKNDGFIPINKNLWSLSFVICLSSFAFFLFAFCYVTIDVYKVWSGAPFYYPGMNAILLYLGHEIISQPVARYLNLGSRPPSHDLYLPINCLDTAVWVLLAYFLFQHKIFFSV